jgi:hypothetical protein
LFKDEGKATVKTAETDIPRSGIFLPQERRRRVQAAANRTHDMGKSQPNHRRGVADRDRNRLVSKVEPLAAGKHWADPSRALQ